MDSKKAQSDNGFEEIILSAKTLYNAKQNLHCPYFGIKIQLTSDGFNHLQYKQNREPRAIGEQRLKLHLLKYVLECDAI